MRGAKYSMVESISHIIASFVAILLLSSVVEKLLDWKKSMNKISDYKIIPKKLNGAIFFIGTIVETYLGIKLVVNQFSLVDCLLYSTLLITYSGAIAINLYRGHIRISCGCGGVLESSELSWKHLLRNFLLIMFGVISYFNKTSVNIFTLEFIIYMLTGANLVILYGVIKEFSLQQKKVKRIKSIVKI